MPMIMKRFPVDRCTFAWPGTYGHECGKPAVAVAVEHGCEQWENGIYYAGRCKECAAIKGGENAGRRIEPLAGHQNGLEVWVP